MALWIDVKELREGRGWLQREAAEKLGCSRTYLAAIESNRRGISVNMLEAIIRVFGVRYEDFHPAGDESARPAPPRTKKAGSCGGRIRGKP